MKKRLSLAVLGIYGILAGCAVAPENIKWEFDRAIHIDSAKNAIITAAQANLWSICEIDRNHLRVDTPFKKWRIVADISYAENGYVISPNLQMTTLANNDGTVHRTVNKLIAKLNKTLAYNLRFAPTDAVEPPAIPKCMRVDYVEKDKEGIIFGARAYTNLSFGWEGEPNYLPKDTKFTYNVVRSGKISDDLVESMRQRLDSYLKESGNLGDVHSEYIIEVELNNFTGVSGGEFVDFINLADAYQQIRSKTVIKNKEGNVICRLETTLRVDTSGFTGLINRESRKITAYLGYKIIETIRNKVLR